MLRLLLISVACLLAACGQKGPLYLPTAPVGHAAACRRPGYAGRIARQYGTGCPVQP
jgi:hypothetical protein